jgi:hypothetical protein
MESWRQQFLGLDVVPASLTPAEIEYFFAPTDQERSLVNERRRSLTRLGLILQIGFLRMTGRSLAAFERLPPAVLSCAAAHAGMPAPQIATLRSIYRRRTTLFEHQLIAAEALGFRPASEHVVRKLTAHLRREAAVQLDRGDLVREARIWLDDNRYLLPGARALEEMAAAAQLHALEVLAAGIRAAVGQEVTGAWASQLSGGGPRPGEALLDWLRAPPAGYGRKEITDVQERISALRRLGADRIVIPDLTIDRMRQHARRIARRKATTLSRLREPRRTVEIGCWLRLQLLELTDTVLEQASRRIGQLWNQARRTVEERALEELGHYRVGLRASRQAREGWDGLLHMVASLEAGYGSPATVIERHGSAAQGTPIYECGTYLGKVLRSLFLLDYLIKPDFRREVHRLLSQGESVHLLQRALMAGRIEARHGRTLTEATAISGALTLLTNIVMAWNTNAMQRAIDRRPHDTFPEPHLAHIAPVAHRHINMQGRIRFAVEEHAQLARRRAR